MCVMCIKEQKRNSAHFSDISKVPQPSKLSPVIDVLRLYVILDERTCRTP